MSLYASNPSESLSMLLRTLFWMMLTCSHSPDGLSKILSKSGALINATMVENTPWSWSKCDFSGRKIGDNSSSGSSCCSSSSSRLHRRFVTEPVSTSSNERIALSFWPMRALWAPLRALETIAGRAGSNGRSGTNNLSMKRDNWIHSSARRENSALGGPLSVSLLVSVLSLEVRSSNSFRKSMSSMSCIAMLLARSVIEELAAARFCSWELWGSNEQWS